MDLGDSRHLELLSMLDSPWVEHPLLLRSAEMMRCLAADRCSGNGTESHDGCRSYHGWWQYWRIVGLVATPDWHSGNYADVFRSDRNDHDFRVLVSGTADYGILCHLAEAIPADAQSGIRIAVLDLCPTPLEMCSWYASEHLPEAALSLHCSDILQAPFGDAEFDLITTYSFLSRFPDHLKEHVVAQWRRMLRPGGKVITTARLGKVPPLADLRPEELSRRVVEAVAGGDPRFLQLGDILNQIASDYVRSGSISYPLPSVEYAHHLFAGFDSTIDVRLLENRFSESRNYALITATKV
jgi:SAM-dependent methyltransferase